jgi:hypothetical protein
VAAWHFALRGNEPEFERLWGGEAALRAAAVDAGELQSIPGDEVAMKARASLHPGRELTHPY